MYRLMRSAKFTLYHTISGPMSSYRQSLVGHFRQSRAAIGACRVANASSPDRYYVLNELGQEYFRGFWID